VKRRSLRNIRRHDQRFAMIRNACFSLAALLLLALPSTSSAYWPYYGAWGGGPWGYPHQYAVGYVPPPPYYSIYPPVYYSPHITMRHYGSSPYAWPAGFSPTSYAVRGYAAKPAEPLMIVNPYVQVEGAAPAPAAGAAAQAKSPAPLRIENPHVASTIR
jgi:hypothetical protein